ncbi:MAG TPA: hypothetical protein VLS25_06960, partial [Dehalococcoidia bacterium]|nr:hypothetical protein [Dehalococcoidia bacterium]
MRFRAVVALCALAVVGVNSTACDVFDQYTVQNDTEQDLVTWASFYPCSEPSGPGSSFNRAEVV